MDAARVGVEQAWLAAGKRGDVGEMRRLRAQHPEWLDLARVVAVPKGLQAADSASPRSPTTFCDWEQFYLATIGDSALHAAAWEGHAPILQYLLEEGQSPDARDDRGMTVLVVTLLRHSVQAMRAVFLGPDIVQLNTVVDCREQDAQRLAHTIEVCSLLIRHGADLNAANEDGKTALHFAANDELQAVAQLLLEAGAFADPADEDGQTPLHYSVESQSIRATAVLITHGARVDLPDRRGISPMALVVAKQDVGALRVMLDHFRQVAAPPGSRSFASHVLLLAAEAGALELVQLIVQGQYAAPDECNQRGETTLHLAIVKHHDEMVRFLGSQMPVSNGTGGFLAPRTVRGESVVHYAARYGTPDTMRFLLEAAGPSAAVAVNEVASPVGRLTCGHTPLFLATTATAGSPQEREGKVILLRELGAKLFGGPAHMFVGVGSPSFGPRSSVLFSWGVRRCVSQWLLESENDMLAPFCLSWAGHLGSGMLGNVAQSLVHCGFAADVVPLLRECRVSVAGVNPLLNDLSVVANASGHDLLRLLHAEVASAWAEITRH